jgi:hypothetical protein
VASGAGASLKLGDGPGETYSPLKRFSESSELSMGRNTIDLELTRAEVEVRELEARLRVVPMNDGALLTALERALALKRDRLARLRSQHEG